ncbi:MAG: Asp-tRNA(Asn)/Glu-tRNA(Gln) amidotransferase subunit GatB [Anaerolineales bacterium]|nr:Asp-tRNA(Asn)/Glu-tRNA(Gln) amidotransferase subunit GatB [Anaerolineales bacterium]
MDYEAVIGMEVHVQLLTESKMFCRCNADYAAAEPNTHVCPVCLGMPGVLPVINQRAIEYTIMTALALNCQIPEFSKFDRKNYFYPDLPKGYQISQYDLPLSRDGWLDLEVDGEARRIGIERVHLEEDTAKLVHLRGLGRRPLPNELGRRPLPNELGRRPSPNRSLVDFNRAGVPLMEIVSRPDIRTPEEARQYLTKLRNIVRYLGVNSGNMEEGAMRCEANISLRPRGRSELGAKVEVKNLNSFHSVKLALEYEIERQAMLLETGGRIEQVTMGWNEARGVTVVQRSKEHAHDYRYFPEPDLPPIVLSREWVEEIRARLPELPDAKRDRFMEQHGLSRYDAEVLTAERPVADYFESCVRAYPDAKTVANWITGELFRLLKAADVGIEAVKITPEALAELLTLVEKDTISISIAKDVFAAMFETGRPASQIVKEKGLVQISDADELSRLVEQVIAENPDPVADYLEGKEAVLRFLVGQVMKATRGKANPKLVNRLLRESLRSQG